MKDGWCVIGDKQVHYINGLEHKDDGPAVIWQDGSLEWWVGGKRHRGDGPAIEYSDGSKGWWANGRRHRIDGPAIEWADGAKEWYVDDKEVDILALFGYLPSVPLSTDEQMILRLTV